MRGMVAFKNAGKKIRSM